MPRHDGAAFRNGWISALLILLVAVATRWVAYGNPVADIDDQFYWLVGTSMADGQWPILDIWDRKPLGLFLIYGAIAAVHPSFLAAKIVATLFAAATALLIRQIALAVASPRSATLAAIAYLLFLPVFGGQTGQSPVFYNLFIAGAGLVTLRAVSAADSRRLLLHALAAMLLCGLALVVKQVSMAEGAYFGLTYLWLMRRQGWAFGQIAFAAAAMIGLALLPSLAALALYASQGREAFDAYLYAAYLSIFAKGGAAVHAHVNGLIYFLLFALPLIAAVVIGLLPRPDGSAPPPQRPFLIGWLVAALVGYLMIPNFFPHYALPMLVPMSVLAALAFERRIGLILFAAMVAAGLAAGPLTDRAGNNESAARFAELSRAIEQHREGGCIHIVNGPSALYVTVPACRLTPYLFPYHLALATEAAALGAEQHEELARVFAQRPAIIVTQDRERPNQAAPVRDLVDRTLARDYVEVYRSPAGGNFRIDTARVWKRRAP